MVLGWARGQQFDAVVVESTHLHSQKLFAKQGMKCISEVIFEEFKDENGELVFKHTYPHRSIQLLMLLF